MCNISGNFIPFFVDISDLLGEDFNIVSRWEIVHERAILRNVSSFDPRHLLLSSSYLSGEKSLFENEGEDTKSLINIFTRRNYSKKLEERELRRTSSRGKNVGERRYEYE